MLNKVLFLIKPDAIQCRQEIAIKKFMRNRKFILKDEKRILLSVLQAKILCKKYKEEVFFNDMIDFLTGGTSIAYIIEGENIIERLKEIVGDLNPSIAEEGTLRSTFINGFFLFEDQSPIYNSVLFSDNIEDAIREINIIYNLTNNVKSEII